METLPPLTLSPMLMRSSEGAPSVPRETVTPACWAPCSWEGRLRRRSLKDKSEETPLPDPPMLMRLLEGAPSVPRGTSTPAWSMAATGRSPACAWRQRGSGRRSPGAGPSGPPAPRTGEDRMRSLVCRTLQRTPRAQQGERAHRDAVSPSLSHLFKGTPRQLCIASSVALTPPHLLRGDTQTLCAASRRRCERHPMLPRCATVPCPSGTPRVATTWAVSNGISATCCTGHQGRRALGEVQVGRGSTWTGAGTGTPRAGRGGWSQQRRVVTAEGQEEEGRPQQRGKKRRVAPAEKEQQSTASSGVPYGCQC